MFILAYNGDRTAELYDFPQITLFSQLKNTVWCGDIGGVRSLFSRE